MLSPARRWTIVLLLGALTFAHGRRITAASIKDAIDPTPRGSTPQSVLPDPSGRSNTSARTPTTHDAADHYLDADHNSVALLRIVDEVAIAGPVDVELPARFAETRATLGLDDPSTTVTARLGTDRQVVLMRSARPGNALAADDLLAVAPNLRTFPVLWDPNTRSRLVATDELILKISDDAAVDLRTIAAEEGLEPPVALGPDRLRSFLVRLRDPSSSPLVAARRLASRTGIEWATPNFLRELSLAYTPNDPLFPWQFSMHNGGQQGAAADADVDAPEAWDTVRDASSVVIAIIDTGVDTSHPDLNIFLNPGESGSGKETNGIDDDGNGLIDDWRGWDFHSNDNNPNPTVAGVGGHGTACAGIAAARIHNASRMTGVAPNARILPVKISSDATDSAFATDAQIGSAISYAAELADVLSNSWGGGPSSSFISAAIHDAATQGRQGRGCVLFFATGNSAGVWVEGRFSIGAFFGPGTFSFGFRYAKDEDDSLGAGEDIVRIDNVVVTGADGYTQVVTPLGPLGRQDFEGIFPPAGWTLNSSSGVLWTNALAHSFQGTAGSRSAQSGAITHNQWTEMRTPKVTLGAADQLRFQIYRSSEASTQTGVVFDGLDLRVYSATGTLLGTFGRYGGIYPTASFVNYPASHSDVIAVGASTDNDRRSDYSQYGPEVDLVAPSSGGWNSIATLDPSGTVGYTAADFSTTFGGTSAATPLAAGVGALLLAVDPTLTATEIRHLLQNSADKIGPVPYTNGFNAYYGFGRVNARAALDAVPNDDTPFVSVRVTDNTGSEPGANTAAFAVVRAGSTLNPLTVNLLVSGSASSGVDFSPIPATVLIPAGATSAPVLVSPL
ncbi:MAG: S8 family serine peptidase, partial [Verrucomicrobiales bacterium]|nr:S8 family serine peptidase [Verrucomicrobiales bacterium]